MNITKKEIDQSNAIISISIDKTDYAEKVEKSLRSYRKKLQMPGFRPGMVPLGLVKKMYGKAILADEINNLVVENLENYIKENNLAILGQPLPSETEKNEIDFDTQEAFDFHFDIGLAPEFEVTLTAKDKVDYYDIAVSEDMIANQIKSYTTRYSNFEQVDTVEEKDMLKGNITELENGAPKADGITATNAVLTPAYMKDEAQKQLFVGKSKGDKVVFNPMKAFDNEAEISSLLMVKKEEIKDWTSDFEIEIAEITRRVESQVNQALFDKVFGEGTVTSEEAFRNKITENIKEQLTQDSEYKFNIDARNLLINKYKSIPMPDAFLKRWVLHRNEEMTAEQIEEEYPKMVDELIWQLIKDKITKDNDIKVEFPDVEAYAKKVAKAQFAQYGMTDLGDDILANYASDMLKQQETMRNFIERAGEEKVYAVIREKVKLTKKEISIDDFNKLFETTV